MPLSDASAKAAKPKDKPYRLSDGRSLFLLIRPDGGKAWQLRFRLDGKEGLASLGTYPAVSLAEARKAADAARELVKAGRHPTKEKQAAKKKALAERENTFRSLAEEWLSGRTLADRTEVKYRWHVEDILNPEVGGTPIAEVTVEDMHEVIRPLVAAGKLETARRTASIASRIFSFAATTGRAENDPAAILMKGEAIPTPKTTGRAAITDPVLLGQFLRAVDAYPSSPIVRQALRILPHVLLRPGELRQSEWEWIDADSRTWSIPAEVMKMRKPHVVPLSDQVLAMLGELRAITGRGRFLFPNARSAHKAMSDMALNTAMRAIGYDKDTVTAHGFRSTASTMLNESGLWSADAVEAQLAHVDKNRIRGTYNKAEKLDERRTMLAWWSDRLDALRTAENVSSLADARMAKTAEA